MRGSFGCTTIAQGLLNSDVIRFGEILLGGDARFRNAALITGIYRCIKAVGTSTLQMHA